METGEREIIISYRNPKSIVEFLGKKQELCFKKMLDDTLLQRPFTRADFVRLCEQAWDEIVQFEYYQKGLRGRDKELQSQVKEVR